MCTQDAVYITISEDDQTSVHCEPLELDTVKDRNICFLVWNELMVIVSLVM